MGPIQLRIFEYYSILLYIWTNILENLEAISYLLTLQNLPLGVRFFSIDSAMGLQTDSASFSRVYLWAALTLQTMPAEVSWCFLFIFVVFFLWMSEMPQRMLRGVSRVPRPCASRTGVFSTWRWVQLFTLTHKPDVPKSSSDPP